MITATDTQLYRLHKNDVQIDTARILRGMGYIETQAPEYLIPLTEEYLSEAEKYADLKVGYAVYYEDQIQVNKSTLLISGYTFNTDKIIAHHLKGAESIIIFAASAGHKFDEWISGLFNSNDQLNGYIADTIGSELVESAGDWLEEKLMQKFGKLGMNCSNRLSPGYCNWNVIDQHKIFALLPKDFCGIQLNESALMKPIKSISGIIAVGKTVKKLDYQCNICNLEHCYKRRRAINNPE